MTTIMSFRQSNQSDRIQQGRDSGALTRGEARELRGQQREIREARQEARADGHVSGAERRQLFALQNEASRDIYQSKHDGQTRQNNTPQVDRREGNQMERIGKGIAEGDLTRHEARRLVGQQVRIHRYEEKAKSDGVVTEKERDKLDRLQDNASGTIHQLRHDRR